MNDLIEELQNFHFTKIEAQIYLSLLKKDVLNGSQIAKEIGVPRTSVYSALDKLFIRGVIVKLPGDPTTYKPMAPSILLKKLKKDYEKSWDTLDQGLSRFQNNPQEDQFWNFTGEDAFQAIVKEMIEKAKDEIYISTNYPLSLFQRELGNFKKRGGRVIAFSFEKITEEEWIEFYYNPVMPDCKNEKRFMMVVDGENSIVLNENRAKEVVGTFTKNTFMVKILSEHIHHDIYFLKLQNKANKKIIDDEVKIQSMFEKIERGT